MAYLGWWKDNDPRYSEPASVFIPRGVRKRPTPDLAEEEREPFDGSWEMRFDNPMAVPDSDPMEHMTPEERTKAFKGLASLMRKKAGGRQR